MEPNKRTTSDLIQAVGEWADKNFTYRGAHWGVLEEVGETAHCILKRAQKIRGYEVDEFFRAELRDAFADVMIYLSDFSYTRSAFFAFKRNQMTAPNHSPEELIVTNVMQAVTSIFNHVAVEESEAPFSPAQVQVYNIMIQRLCSMMELWARHYGMDLEQITWEVWDAKVSKRNWKQNPKDADKRELSNADDPHYS